MYLLVEVIIKGFSSSLLYRYVFMESRGFWIYDSSSDRTPPHGLLARAAVYYDDG